MQIPEPDALVQVLKACLRTPNQHLTTATLAALPPLVPLLVTRAPAQIPLPSSSSSPAASTSSASASPVDAHALRMVLTQLMPAGGGVLDRLGDTRDRPRECARETLVAMGGFAFRAGGGAVLGDGRAWLPWIGVGDWVGAAHHVLMTESLAGPVNLTGPNPVTNRDFTHTLARVLRRPALLRLPRAA